MKHRSAVVARRLKRSVRRLASVRGHDMKVTKIIHEGGLTSRSASESSEILEKYGARPVLAIDEDHPSGENFDLLLSRGGALLAVQGSSLYFGGGTNVALLFKKFALAYDIGAAMHHCVNLAKAYELIVANFRRISSIPGFEASDLATFGYQAEPYYEFDALVSAARRAYDKAGHCVWQAFEGGDASMPKNIAQLLDRLRACPRPLSERLRNSWLTVGQKLKDYRDCTQHFASTDLGMGAVMMKGLGVGVWKAWARIPDNPEANSKKKFTYIAGLDALTYGWDVVNEVVSLATEVVTAAASAHE